jgi:hypothetical protein
VIERLAIVAILIVLVAVASLAIRARARARASRAYGRAIPSELLSDAALRGPSVLYFFGPHCALCRQQGAVLDALEAQEGMPVTRIDAAHHAQLARSLGIMTVPATAVLDRGQIRTVNLGPRSLQELEAQLAG